MAIKSFLNLVCSLSMLLASMAWAHHSPVGFDPNKRFIFAGKVREFAWINPHAYIYVDVMKGDGSTELWGFEVGSPNTLDREGWQRDDFKPGTQLTIYGSAARNSKRNALLSRVILPDGREFKGGNPGDVLADPKFKAASSDAPLPPGTAPPVPSQSGPSYVKYQ